MATYTLVIEQTACSSPETKAYSTAANAIDDMEGWQASGATVSAIMRDGLPIDEATLRTDDGEGLVIDVG